MRISPIANKTFGARVTNVHLSDIDEKDLAQIKAAFLKFGFLVFPDQHLTVEQNIRFGKWFGELEFGGIPMANQQREKDGSFGKIFDLDSQRMRTNIGNEAWHTDSTYWPISSKCAMLSAVIVPDKGGETQLADMRAGYDGLDDSMKNKIDGLSAYHSTQFSQANDLGDFPKQSKEGIYHGEAYLLSLIHI